ncbi:peptidase S8/S53 domain-containing protein [Lactarius quietus]|nr:peptidase S8/S53 domain-containing protein [Lactarius quietus]
MPCHRIFVFSVLATLIGLVTAFSPHWHDMRTKHSWPAVPHGWEWVGRPQNTTTIDLYVALKSHRENALIDALYEVSTPGNQKQVFFATYGQHLSKEQVAELVAPHPDTLNLVHSWLDYNGISSSSISLTHGGNSLRLSGVSLSQANDLLGASYQIYRHITTNETIVRTTGYALPAALLEHVQTVVPTTSFDCPRTQWHQPRKGFDGAEVRPDSKDVVSRKPVTVSSSRDVTRSTIPAFLRWLYSTWAYSPVVTGQSRLGIVGFNWQYPSLQDLRLCDFDVVLVGNGAYDPRNPGDEANLDMQYAQGIAYPIRHIFYSTGPGLLSYEDWLLTFLGNVIDDPNIPQTFSLSYGNNETDYPIDYAIHACNLFAQLGSRGVSVLQASGNQGIGLGDCTDSSGDVRFLPSFPATCPYITTVGGTMNSQPEIAAPFSGGGFSNIFLRPLYQEQVVPTFLQNFGDQYQGMYFPLGRAIPDISAQAESFRFFLRGNLIPASGTSGATPIVAGIISLLNDHRISQGKPPEAFSTHGCMTRPGRDSRTSKKGRTRAAAPLDFQPSLAGTL